MWERGESSHAVTQEEPTTKAHRPRVGELILVRLLFMFCARWLTLAMLVLTRPRLASASLLTSVHRGLAACPLSSRKALARGCVRAMASSATTPSASPRHRRASSVSAPRLPGLDVGGPGVASELKLFNSLTLQTEPFVPIDPNLVKWYVRPDGVRRSAVGHARQLCGVRHRAAGAHGLLWLRRALRDEHHRH